MFSENEITHILKCAESHIGTRFEKGFNCIDFVFLVYDTINPKLSFNDFPVLSLKDIYKEQYIGFPCFLKHKIHGQHRRFSHVGIIAPNRFLIHYSRYFGEPNVREVFKTSFEDIFSVYDFAAVPMLQDT